MPFDMAILDTTGKPREKVGLGVEDHSRLLKISTALNLKLIGRMHDYYEDVDYEAEEIPELIEEIKIAIKAPKYRIRYQSSSSRIIHFIIKSDGGKKGTFWNFRLK